MFYFNVTKYKHSSEATTISIISAIMLVIGVGILFGQYGIEGAGRYISAAILIGLAILFQVLSDRINKNAIKKKIKNDADFAISVWRENPKSEQELVNLNPNILSLIEKILENECRCEECGELYPKSTCCALCGSNMLSGENSIMSSETLDSPAYITIIREKWTMGGAAKFFEYVCNGEVVGKLENGQSLKISTYKAQNLVGVKKSFWKNTTGIGSKAKLIYCMPGSHIGVHFLESNFSHISFLNDTENE